MANVFNSVKGLHPKRNAFSAHTYRNDFTSLLGVNIPIYQQHVVPGTRIKVSTSALVRLQALIAPIMDNIDFYVHFWKIPYRLLENDMFTSFISGEVEPSDYDALFVTPYAIVEEMMATTPLTLDDYTASEMFNLYFGDGSLFDFLGYDKGLFPQIEWNSDDQQFQPKYGTGNNETLVNLRPFLAYYMLHLNWYMNENVPYFRNFESTVNTFINDQDLSAFCFIYNETIVNFGTSFLPHGWEKDYFTSALPNVQFGSPVTLNLASSAPVSIPAQNVHLYEQHGLEFKFDANVEGEADLSTVGLQDPGLVTRLMSTDDGQRIEGVYGKLSKGTFGNNNNALTGTADLSEASAITINELRVANALQVFKERQLRFGRRRQEYYKGFFDVTPEDLRLQIPKYLGGGRIPINIADIEQTSQTSGTQALGHLAGKATAVAGGFAGFQTFCSEESIIIGIAFAMPHITYCQSISRMLLKTNDPYDYFNPSFEHLGEQQIDNIEIYAPSGIPNNVFGYTPRFNEYRFHNNEMHGEFKSSLSYWTLGRIFSSQPALNPGFVYMQPSVFNRIFAVDYSYPMLASVLFRVRLIQPVSKYGTPRLMV